MHSKKIRNILIKATAFLVIASASAMPGAASWAGRTNGGIEAFALELQGTVTVTCSALWTYSRPDWTAKVKVAYKGESFAAVEKISVAGRDMYRLSNGMYISANPLYVSFRESSQAPAPVVQASSAMAATANLNMRTGPGTGYQIIRVIPKGAQVSVSGSENGWYKVTYQGATGWASGSYLTPVQAQAPAPAPSVTSTYIKTTANLNMRTGAGTGYAIITTIPAGTKLESLGTSGGWHKVSFSGRTGWVSGSYVTILSGYSQKVIGIPYVNQYSPVYAPMGCEGASLLMALKYKGYASLDLKAFLDAMPKTERDPFNGFASTPYTVVSVVPEIFQSIFPEALTAYGIRYSGNVADVSGYSTAQLKAEIDKGNPVVVYVTTRNYETPVWKVYDMGPSGNVNIVDNMHVMVLTGYNSDGEYHVTDPASSRNTYWVSQVKFETAYNALKWAVVVR
jgi:uncharacterized protein YvpB